VVGGPGEPGGRRTAAARRRGKGNHFAGKRYRVDACDGLAATPRKTNWQLATGKGSRTGKRSQRTMANEGRASRWSAMGLRRQPGDNSPVRG